MVGLTATVCSRLTADLRLLKPTDDSRPKPVCRVSPKRSDAQLRYFVFRFYEAAVRDFTHPAINGHS